MIEKIFSQDLVLIDLAGSIGHELQKTRPCIVIKTFQIIRMALIVPLSHGIPKKLFTNVELKQNGEISYAQCHQLRSISYDRIIKKLGVIVENDFNKIRITIADFLED